MKKILAALMLIIAMVWFGGVAQATPTVVDFHGVQLRGANSDGTYGTIIENAGETGATATTNLAGQKVYYGTAFFDGLLFSDINYIQFDYSGPANAPYVNLAVTDGLSWGVVALSADIDLSAGVVKYASSPYAIYEQTGAWGTVLPATAYLGTPRTPKPGELGSGYNLSDPRGPIHDSLVVMWGDSLGNYIGTATFTNLFISTSRGDYAAGKVPEPATLMLLGFGLIGLAAGRKR